MPRITATSRLFQRTRGVLDGDGWMVWTFDEARPPCDRLACKPLGNRLWVVRESPSGLRLGTLQQMDAVGTHTRALRRIEEDHLMKFAIRD